MNKIILFLGFLALVFTIVIVKMFFFSNKKKGMDSSLPQEQSQPQSVSSSSLTPEEQSQPQSVSSSSLTPEEQSQAETLSKILPPVKENFRFKKQQDMTLNDPVACYSSSNKEYEKNLIETILNLLTSDSYYNSFKAPLPDVKAFFMKVKELYEKIKSENGSNINYTAFIFFITRYYINFIRRILMNLFTNPNANLTEFYTSFVLWFLLLNYKFILHPKNTTKKFVISYDKNSNKVSMDIDFIENMYKQQGKDMGQSDEEIQQRFDESFPPELQDISKRGGSPAEWTNTMTDLFFNYDAEPGFKQQVMNMPVEQIQEQIQESFKVGSGDYEKIQQRIDSPEYAKMYNINYTQKPCRDEF